MNLTRNYKEFMRPRLRMAMLQLMEQLPRGQSNSSMMSDVLRRGLFVTSREEVKQDLRWLAERGLVVVDEEAGQVLVVSITQAGRDCVNGDVDVDGVERLLRDN